MIAAISLGLILKFILLGELSMFVIWCILALAYCFVDWSWRYILSIDWEVIRMAFVYGLLLGVIEFLGYLMFNLN